MQMKTTSTILPELDKRNHTLISIINPTECEDGNARIRQSQNCSLKMNCKDLKQLFCKRCGCQVLELMPNMVLNHKKNALFCKNCHLHAVQGKANQIQMEKTQGTTLNAENKNNKKQERHYCDKCRFISKDLRRFKKHIMQHEAIQFVCSYCSLVSYTKGEFQQHLVKHTGIFPFKCEYCEYGAIRNDYIVKHVRRVHGSEHELYHECVLRKDERKNKCLTVALPEEQNEEEKDGFQKHGLHTTSSADVSETDFEMCTAISLCILENDEPVESPNVGKSSLCCNFEDTHVCDNCSVEVEVLASDTNLLQCGKPLTVVAPPHLEFPPNTLAKLMEVKMGNGFQTLVLKLFQEKECYSEYLNSKADELGISDVVLKEFPRQGCLDESKPFLSNDACAKYSDLNEFFKLKCNCANNSLAHQHLFSSCDAIGHLTIPKQDVCDELGALENQYVQLNCNNSIPPTVYNCSCDIKSCDEAGAQWELKKMPDGTNCCHIFSRDHHQFSTNIDRDEKFISVTDTETCYTINSFSNPSLDSCGNVLGLHSSLVPENWSTSESKSVQTVNYVNDETEGPFILSVFSLSSGADNFPEGINWDADSICKMEPPTLSDSNVSSMLCTSRSHENIGSCEIMGSPKTENLALNNRPESSEINSISINIPDDHSSFPTKMQVSNVQQNNVPAPFSRSKRNKKKTVFHMTDSISKPTEDDGCKPDAACTKYLNLLPNNVGLNVRKSALPRVTKGSVSRHVEKSALPRVTKGSVSRNLELCKGTNPIEYSNVTQELTSLSSEAETNNTLKEQPSSLVADKLSGCPTKTQSVCSNNRNLKVRKGKCKSSIAKCISNNCPVFIPQGTILTVLNCNGIGKSKQGKRCKHLKNLGHGFATFLPRPVLFQQSVELRKKSKKLLEKPESKKKVKRKSNHDSESNQEDKPKQENKAKQKRKNSSFLIQKQKRFKISLKKPLKQSTLEKSAACKKNVKPCVLKGTLCKKKINALKQIIKPQKKALIIQPRHLRLIPILSDQFIICPRQNQPVVVLNHPDVDSVEVANIMKIIKQYKGQVRGVFLSERTMDCIYAKTKKLRLTCDNVETILVTKKPLQPLKPSTIHACSGPIENVKPDLSEKSLFKCWFCGSEYQNRQEWITHGQSHLVQSTKELNSGSLTAES